MSMRLYPHITADIGVLSGQPVVEGTAIPVSLLVKQIAVGKSVEEVAREHGVTVEDVRAALEYAAQRASEPPPALRREAASGAESGEKLSSAVAEEARQLGLDVSKMSPLGRDLLEIRARAAAEGEQFLNSWEELEAEIADRRGGVYPYPDVDE